MQSLLIATRRFVRRGAKPAEPTFPPSSPFRGILVALLLSVPLWAVVILIVYWAFGIS